MSTLGGSLLYSATRIRLDFSGRRTDTRTAVLVSTPFPCHPEPTDGFIHTSLTKDPTTGSVREDVTDDMKMPETYSSTILQTVTRCEGDCNIDGGLAARQRGDTRAFEKEE
jgi:hypothetical protein